MYYIVIGKDLWVRGLVSKFVSRWCVYVIFFIKYNVEVSKLWCRVGLEVEGDNYCVCF